jgi:hypothetical protein
MSRSEGLPLVEIDPEIERTLLRRWRELKQQATEVTAKMGEPKSLRELWIPNDQTHIAEMNPPVIQANNFELKPALINMVQHNSYGGSPMEDPHEHIRNFLEYCNTLKCNGVTPDVIRMQLFPFSLKNGAKQ